MHSVFEVEKDFLMVRDGSVTKSRLESLFLSYVGEYLRLLRQQESYRNNVDIEISTETDYRNCAYNNIVVSAVDSVWTVEQLADKVIEYIMDDRDSYVLSNNYSLCFWAANPESEEYRITPMAQMKDKLVLLLDDASCQKRIGDVIRYNIDVNHFITVMHDECDF